MPIESCYCCGRDVSEPTEKKQRRLLSSSTMQTVLQTLTALVRKMQRKVTDLQVDLSTHLSKGFICRPCVRLLERYQSIHEEVLINVTKALPILKVAMGTGHPDHDPLLCSGHGSPSVALVGGQMPSLPLPDLSPLEKQMQVPSALEGPSGNEPREVGQQRSESMLIHQDNPTASPTLTATIHYKSWPKSFCVTPSRRQICKPLLRRNFPSFAKKCTQNVTTRKAMIKSLSSILKKEVAALCSNTFPSVMRCKPKQISVDFGFKSLLKELSCQAPTLLELLKSCLKTKTPRVNVNLIVAMIAALICKHRRSSCSLLQRVISLVLYSGHSSKQVYQRLQKIGLCLSHRATIDLVDSLGETFDEKVKEWKQVAENKMSVEQTNDGPAIIPLASLGQSPSPSPSSASLTNLNFCNEAVASSPCAPSCTSVGTLSQRSNDDNDSDDNDSGGGDSDQSASFDGGVDVPVSQAQPGNSELDCNEPSLSINPGYKVVFDNLNKNIKPRHMRIDSQTQSLNCVQSYAVKDRVDYSVFSDEAPSEFNVFDILPSDEDYSSLKSEFSILVSRVLIEFMPFFSENFKVPTKHIPHRYSSQMAKKSEAVPLGILLKSETNYEDMTEILEHYQTYVPSVNCEKHIPEMGTTQDKKFLTTLLGGDYLSVARARGAQMIRSTSEFTKHTLGGILPVAEDWHAKVCFMEVIWHRLFNTRSGMEKGTLYQLRNLINRRNVTKAVKSDVNSNEDFLEVVVKAYILVAAMDYLGMSALDSQPLPAVVSPDIWMLDDATRRSVLTEISTSIVDKHVDLATEFRNPPPDASEAVDSVSNDVDKEGEEASVGESDQSETKGTVYDYTREVLSLGLLYLNFKDAVREGDGDRVMRMWKYFLPLFKATGHKNYALESLAVLSQYVTLPPNLAEQLKWSRFINTCGQPGRNISCDLYMEHLNRIVKVAIEGLGANQTEKAIVRVGKSVGLFTEILDAFDDKAGVPVLSGKHGQKSMTKDLQEIIKQLLEIDIFDTSCAHMSFSKLKPNLIRKLLQKDVKAWIIKNFSI